jgi:hypothetical protein
MLFDVEKDTYGALAKVGVSCDACLEFSKRVVCGALSTKAELFGGRRLLDSSVNWRRLVKILSKILPVMLRSEMGR